jgi:hypothetical protein
LGNHRALPLYASESQYTDAAGASQYLCRQTKYWSPHRDCKALWLTQASSKWMNRNLR